MLCFEDIDESTSTLPFLTNSKVDTAGFVNFHRMAPIKKPIFTLSKWTKWRRIIIFQSCPRATHYNATTCTITLCMAIVEKKSHQYLVPMLIQCV